jgi:hypothetical protein
MREKEEEAVESAAVEDQRDRSIFKLLEAVRWWIDVHTH